MTIGTAQSNHFDPTDEQLGRLGTHFAPTNEEAKSRYDRFRSRDPFPAINPALLNIADVCQYVAKTGMIWPFKLMKEDLKFATYSLRLIGKIIYWDGEGVKCEKDISEGDDFVMKADSIAFVSLEPMLRIPHYIALRFNLRVDNVYRGLLLGTGPVIDPGFEGRLSIPLHNLTTNDYTFRGGDRLIAIDFTKLSPHPRLQPPGDVGETPIPDLQSLFIPYPPAPPGVERDLKSYLRQASPHQPVRSSIPNAIGKAVRAAQSASRLVTISTVAGAIVVLTIIISFAAFVMDYMQHRQELVDELRELRRRVERIEEEESQGAGANATGTSGSQASDLELE